MEVDVCVAGEACVDGGSGRPLGVDMLGVSGPAEKLCCCGVVGVTFVEVPPFPLGRREGFLDEDGECAALEGCEG